MRVRGRGGVRVTIPPPVMVVETVTITSSNPPTLEAPTTHQITYESRGPGGVVLTGRTEVWATSDGAAATVSGTGLVTSVAPGAATITLKVDGVPADTSVVFTVTSPLATVTQIVISPATVAVTIGSTTQLTAVPKDASNNVVLGQTLTQSEPSGAGDVTISGYAGAETHAITVLGTGVGDRVVRYTHAASGITADRTVTVNALPVGGLTDSAGIFHELMDLPGGVGSATALPHVVRFFASSKGSNGGPSVPSTGFGCGSTLNGDYSTGWCEGCDDAGETLTIITTDTTVPFQAEREAVCGVGKGQYCGEFRCSNGQLGGVGFGKVSQFELTSTRYNSAGHYVSPCFNRKPRQIYHRQIIKIQPDFPDKVQSKWNAFLNPRGANNNFMMQLRSGSQAGTTANLFTAADTNHQGTPDNDLTDNAVLTNSNYAQGVCYLANQPPGVALATNYATGVWYDEVRKSRINTYGGPYTGTAGRRGPGQTGDGTHEFWRRESVDGVTWSQWSLRFTQTGMLNQLVNTTTQNWWSNVVSYYQEQWLNNTGVTGRIRIAYFGTWFGEFE